MSALEVESIQQLRQLEVLSPLDLHFARSMGRLCGEDDETVLVAAAMTSRQVRMGHVCLDLAELSQRQLALDLEDAAVQLRWPEPGILLERLSSSPLCGGAVDRTPLVLADQRLYLRRYFEHERSLAESLERRLQVQPPLRDDSLLQQGLDRLFGAPPVARSPVPRRRKRVPEAQLELFGSEPTETKPDLQRAAARAAVERALCVISGGPGTGKTSTVVKILALIVEQALAQGRPPPRVHLMAPTGKAAARLSEAIAQAKQGLACDPQVSVAIEEQASTIHRALGSLRGGRGFRRDRHSPLASDVVVVDEASMVDLALMARLCEAVPDTARLILLGDKNQLSSVEAGAVLGDICGAGVAAANSSAPIASAVVHLERSYRYAEGSGIARLAQAVLAGDAALALSLLRDPALPDVRLVERVPAPGELPPELEEEVVAGFAPALAASDPMERLSQLSRFRVLCAHRHGPQGVIAQNPQLESALRRAGCIQGGGSLYPGRPILVTQNDYRSGLFNGDIGVIELQHSEQRSRGHGVAFFATAGGELRVSAVRLPAHETVYAMSVHKSQGSEFDRVAIVLPSDPSPVLSRELLYTAITRAKTGLVLFSPPEIVRYAVSTAVRRASGLGERLWRFV